MTDDCTSTTSPSAAGFYEAPWGEKVPRLQILTVGELLAGTKIDYKPVHQAPATFKQAPKHKGKRAQQMGMGMDEK